MRTAQMVLSKKYRNSDSRGEGAVNRAPGLLCDTFVLEWRMNCPRNSRHRRRGVCEREVCVGATIAKTRRFATIVD